jgi:hypothetical protein
MKASAWRRLNVPSRRSDRDRVPVAPLLFDPADILRCLDLNQDENSIIKITTRLLRLFSNQIPGPYLVGERDIATRLPYNS